MSSFLFKKIETNSTEFASYSSQESPKKINQNEFLTKKRERKEKKKIFEIKKDYRKKYETKLSFCEKKPKYDAFQNKNSKEFLNEKNSFHINEDFIKMEANGPFKIKNPLLHEFQSDEINLEENNELKFDYSLQEISEDHPFLPSSPKYDYNPLPCLYDIRDLLFSNNSMKESSSKVSKQVENEKLIILKSRKYRADNMRTKLKRRVFHDMRVELNEILIKSGCKIFFDFLPNSFVSDTKIERVKPILNMTLNEIFMEENLYKFKSKDEERKFNDNFGLVNSEEIKNNEKIQNILNKTFRQFYEDYINSDKFNVDEINRLKKDEKIDNYYIERYIIVAKNLISFYSQ